MRFSAQLTAPAMGMELGQSDSASLSRCAHGECNEMAPPCRYSRLHIHSWTPLVRLHTPLATMRDDHSDGAFQLCSRWRRLYTPCVRLE